MPLGINQKRRHTMKPRNFDFNFLPKIFLFYIYYCGINGFKIDDYIIYICKNNFIINFDKFNKND